VPAARARADSHEALVNQLGQPARRSQGARRHRLQPPSASSNSSAARWRRTLIALEPVSAAAAARNGRRQCVSRASGPRPRLRSKSHLLRPLGALYGAVATKRLQREGLDAGIPVLWRRQLSCRRAPARPPTVLALAKLLARSRRKRRSCSARGYGRQTCAGQSRSIRRGHGCGRRPADEPLMLAARVAGRGSRAQRADGVPLARSLGASVILMDDGFQSPAVAKDASLIVIDGSRGLGNGQVFPAGPLAALPAAAAKSRAHRCTRHCRLWHRRRRGGGRHRRTRQAGAACASRAG